MRYGYRSLFSSLSFRIVAPVFALMLLTGVSLYEGVLRSVSNFAAERIKEDLRRNARDIYTLCDLAMQEILTSGNSIDESAIRISKGLVLGEIEEYAQQNNLNAIVFSGDERKVMLNTAPSWLKEEGVLNAAADNVVQRLSIGAEHFYVHHVRFELWEWDVVLLRNTKTYATLVSEVEHSYVNTGFILMAATLLLVYYLKRIVRDPIQSIISSIRAEEPPQYRGIREYEFLSDNIRDAATRQREKQDLISHQATHDSLTDLPNRREFEHRLQRAMQAAEKDGSQHALLYLDLDQFKVINDVCGHSAGDEVLRQLSSLLQSTLRQTDTLARLGGDEFGVLLENCPVISATRIAEHMRQAVKDFSFVWSDKVFPLGVSIGVVSFGNDGFSLSDILRMADASCYVAKDNGRNRIHVYHDGDREIAERQGEMDWIGRINKALDGDQMALHAQRIMPLQKEDGGMQHYEMLLRMYDDAGKLISPASFIPAAERYNLMPMVDRWVIKSALFYYAELSVDQRQRFGCCINLSGKSINDEQFLPWLRSELNNLDFLPDTICFEITETVAIANLARARYLITELKALGCLFTLDDFGSGMSSFGYLKNLPVDFLKIDGSLVENLVDDPASYAMVEAINRVGQVMGLQTIAERVESQAAVEALRKIGVDYAQGYVIHRPCPIESLRLLEPVRAA